MCRGLATLALLVLVFAGGTPDDARAQSALPDPAPMQRAVPVARPPVRSAAGRTITRPAAGGKSATSPASRPPRGSASPWGTLGALGVIVGLVVAGARLWKKHGPAVAHGLPAEALELLGRRRIDRRQAIHLVRCGGRILVLGSSEAGLRTLAEITDPVEVDTLAGLCRRSGGDSAAAPSFSTIFHKRHAEELSTPYEPPAPSPWEPTHV